MIRIGELFAGIGGLGLAASYVTGGRVVWQVERDAKAAAVLSRRRPHAGLLQRDVTDITAQHLEPVDLLTGGFPCQDLSVAGNRAGLDGARSGLYREMMRLTQELRPGAVLVENVPGLLKYRDRLDAHFGELGYLTAWTTATALEAGAPHRRRRVFVLAWRPGCLPPVERLYRRPAWAPEQSRPWPTATAGDAKASGSRSLAGSEAHAGTSLTDAVRPDRSKAGPWPTPKSRDYRSGTGTSEASLPKRQGSRDLPEVLKGRLNPFWVETLMGFPIGWTLPHNDAELGDEDALRLLDAPRWPAGWVRTDPDAGPQFAWEPPRLLYGAPVPGRPARLRQLGNAVCPHEGAHALSLLLEQATKS